MLYNLYLIA